mmetsp:Transcript_72397/g.146849  ORF Transcript_72397/g.146849 Transcript_72397/m.146849 type:complete len:86 (+) Transcript_72397:569-826(+)
MDPIESEPRVSEVAWVCAECEMCGMDNSPFTDRETHRCKACGKRVHGILRCVEHNQDEENTGIALCNRLEKRRRVNTVKRKVNEV